MDIWTGFIIGLVGSLHCIGMCGPIVLALPVETKSTFSLIFGRILYNLGRVFTYSLFGAVFGLFGNKLLVAGLQQYASIALGVMILLSVFLPSKWKAGITSIPPIREINEGIKNLFSKLMVNANSGSLFLFGIVNGFLPCGFVYVGVAGAISTGSLTSGIFYMALFGLGTVPVMFVTSLAGKLFSTDVRRRINKLIPLFAVILAIIFILRGLNLGIPYLSPNLEKMATSGKMMH